MFKKPDSGSCDESSRLESLWLELLFKIASIEDDFFTFFPFADAAAAVGSEDADEAVI